jgi:hypothetical protein
MYEFVLILHSGLRLAVVALAVMVFVRGLSGVFSGRLYTRGDRTAGLALVVVADIQFLVGLALYFVWSPHASTALRDMGAAMKNPELRRVAVEHPVMMIAALAFLHIGNVLRKRADTDALRHRWMAITVGLALLLLVVGSSWPWTDPARPILFLGGTR